MPDLSRCYVHPQSIVKDGKYWFQTYEDRTFPEASRAAVQILELCVDKPVIRVEPLIKDVPNRDIHIIIFQ